MNNKKMTWDEIKKLHDKEWIELIDFEWAEGDAYPRSGVVRVHSADRRTFYALANKEPRPQDSAILFVGKAGLPAGTILCSSFLKIEHANSSN